MLKRSWKRKAERSSTGATRSGSVLASTPSGTDPPGTASWTQCSRPPGASLIEIMRLGKLCQTVCIKPLKCKDGIWDGLIRRLIRSPSVLHTYYNHSFSSDFSPAGKSGSCSKPWSWISPSTTPSWPRTGLASSAWPLSPERPLNRSTCSAWHMCSGDPSLSTALSTSRAGEEKTLDTPGLKVRARKKKKF